jgi:very-short-patch-repair endonuclease
MDPKVTSRSWDASIAALAKRQYGVVGRRQLLDFGMSTDAVRGRLRRGSLHQIHRGVYVVGVRRVSRRGRWMAAVLAAGPEAVLSHRAAGCLWGFLSSSLNRLEVTCPAGRRARHSGIECHEVNLAADEVTEIDGIPVTSVFRTLFDLAGDLRPRQFERAWKEVKVRRLTDRVPMAVLLDRHPTKRGAAAIRRLAISTKPIPVTRNEFEERFLAVLGASDLLRPRFNAPLHLRGQFFEPDCLWEPQKLIAELDGGEVHNTDHAFQSDRRRDRILLAEGYRTIRITWEQLRDEPDQVVADLRLALTRGPVQPGQSPHPPGK